MQRKHHSFSPVIQAPLSRRFLFLLLLFLVLLGEWHCTSKKQQMRSSPPSPCLTLPKEKITGWVDRIEGPCAIIWMTQRQKILNIPLKSLPHNIREGDHLIRGHIDRPSRKKLLLNIIQLQTSFQNPKKILKIQ